MKPYQYILLLLLHHYLLGNLSGWWVLGFLASCVLLLHYYPDILLWRSLNAQEGRR